MADSRSAYLRTFTHNLFTKPVFTDLEDCRAQGDAASCQMFARDDNPYPVGTAQREWWDTGWVENQEDLLGGG